MLAKSVLFGQNSLCTLAMRRIQQDPLEHFFSIVRLRCGINNNPTTVQFKYILRRILVAQNGGITPSLMGNCQVIDDNDIAQDNPFFDIANTE